MARLPALLLFVVVYGCSGSGRAPSSGAPSATAITTMPKFDAAQLLDHIKVLSSDEFEGRKPGTKGEELTVKYLEDAFKTLGLKPGNSDGTYIQKVPMVGITATNTTPLSMHARMERK